MLEGLDGVPWSELTHAYGPATDVPDMLRKLTSADPVSWVGAIDQLYGAVFHQETIYSATAPAIRFLIKLLRDPRVKCRGKILQYLADVVEAPCGTDEDEDENALGEEYRQLCRATIQAVWSGWKTYLRAGSDVDLRLRVSAPKLLAEMSATPREVISSVIAGENPHREIPDTLRRWFVEEPNAIVQASLVMALAKWSRHDPACLPFVREQLVESERGVTPVRLAAAMALAEHPDPPQAALDVFVAVLKEPDWCRDTFSDTRPSVEDRHDPLRRAMKQHIDGAEAVEALDRGGDDTGVDEDFRYPWIVWEVMGDVLRQMSRLSARDCQTLAEPLVKMVTAPHACRTWQATTLIRKAVFHDVDLKRTVPVELTQHQRDILTFLFDNAECWVNSSGNTEDSFQAMGVPYDRQELARLLSSSAEVTSADEAERHLLRLVRSESRGRKGAPRPGESLTKDHFRFLESLWLRQLGSDAFMPLVDRFPELKVLEIGKFTTDRGLAALGKLPRLKRIWLNENITDQGFAELLRFPTLDNVGAVGSRITDASAAVIAKLSNLTELCLNATHLGDAGLRIIADSKLPLEKLYLHDTAITDASVDALATLDRLWILHVVGTAITEGGIAKLQRALPECRIYR